MLGMTSRTTVLRLSFFTSALILPTLYPRDAPARGAPIPEKGRTMFKGTLTAAPVDSRQVLLLLSH